MKYDQALLTIFAETSIPDGYQFDFGDTVMINHWTKCKLGLIGNKVICIHDHGFHSSVLPPVIDTKEALWMIENHGNYKKYFKNTARLERVNP